MLATLLFGIAWTLAVHMPAYGQELTVTGQVTSEEGDTLPGVNVVVKGTTVGTATDAQGNYRLGVPSPQDTLVFSYIGFVTEEVPIDGRSEIDVTLTSDAEMLDEVVVVGYGTLERESVTAAISKVSGADIAEAPVAAAAEALQGLSPGITVTGDEPGEAPQIRIRGLTTPNSNSPLFVVDGVPVGNTLGVNANDIESIEVLKDAASASIYGSRAAGGVVLITTKRGMESRSTQVDFNAYAGFQSVANTVDLLSAPQYVNTWTEIYETSGQQVPTVLQDLGSNPQSYDYQDLTFQRGTVMNYNLALSGGNETAQYRVSGGYLSQEGTIVGSGYDRFSFRTNTDFDLGRIRLGESLSITHSQRDNVVESQGRSVIEHMVKFAPYLPPRDSNLKGGFNGPDQTDGNDAQNPLRLQLLGTNETQQTQITGNVYGELDIMESLMLRSVFGVDAAFIRDHEFRPSFRTGSFFSDDESNLSETRTTFFSPVGTVTLNYDRSFGSHQISAVAGGEIDTEVSRGAGAEGVNAISDQLRVPGTVENPVAVGDKTRTVLLSGFGRVNYNYRDRYLAQVSLRRDGSSRFGTDSRWGTFPAFSVGWNLAEEAFMEDSPFSMLKLRGSWGQVGNSNAVEEYETQSTVSTNHYYILGGERVTAATIEALSNPTLKWETTTMTNVGADVAVLNDRLNFSGEYYRNTTDDILLLVAVPGSFGYVDDPRFNTGTVTTSGFEFSLDYRSSIGEVDWGIAANFGTATNEVESLGQGLPIQGATWQGSTITRVAEGEPIYYFYGYKMDGLYQQDEITTCTNEAGQQYSCPVEGLPHREGVQPGDIKFVDTNGDDVITPEDRTNIGNPLPEYTYGLTADLQWKGIDFSTILQGAGGHQVYRAWAYWTQGMARMFNAEEAILDRWTPQNTDTDVPRGVLNDPANNRRPSSERWVEDGDYLRLKLVTLGYTVPMNFAPQVSNLRVYAQARNVLTLTGYDGFDPEIGVWSDDPGDATSDFGVDYGQQPQPRTFTVGVQLGF